ncbi:hypothetical protein EDB83DRAFT_761427 [Lactarius deliciosus]|nr:hypothetical protein EDB83DRAFT_761427 [Lactarius deliciosus]
MLPTRCKVMMMTCEDDQRFQTHQRPNNQLGRFQPTHPTPKRHSFRGPQRRPVKATYLVLTPQARLYHRAPPRHASGPRLGDNPTGMTPSASLHLSRALTAGAPIIGSARDSSPAWPSSSPPGRCHSTPTRTCNHAYRRIATAGALTGGALRNSQERRVGPLSLLPPSRPLERSTSNHTGACSQHVTNAGPFLASHATIHRFAATSRRCPTAAASHVLRPGISSLLRFYCLLKPIWDSFPTSGSAYNLALM